MAVFVNLKAWLLAHGVTVGLPVRLRVDEGFEGLYAREIAILLDFVYAAGNQKGWKRGRGIELQGKFKVGEGQIPYFFLKSESFLSYSSCFLE